MQIGVVGLGRMGGNIARRLMKHGHQCVVFDQNPAPGKALAGEGATAPAICDMVAKLNKPRVVWLMLPQGPITGRGRWRTLEPRHHHRRWQRLL